MSQQSSTSLSPAFNRLFPNAQYFRGGGVSACVTFYPKLALLLGKYKLLPRRARGSMTGVVNIRFKVLGSPV